MRPFRIIYILTNKKKSNTISIIDISIIDIVFLGGYSMAREQLKTLTEQMYYILLSLMRPNHGYGIMQEVEEKTNGRVRIGAGTLYNLLSRFEEEDIIRQISEEDRKKTYIITEKGMDILKEEYQRLIQLVSDGKCLSERSVQDE